MTDNSLKVLQITNTKEDHLKRLKKLSEDSLGVIPHLDEPTYEEKEWILFRLSHNNTWHKVQENRIGDVKNWI